MSGIKEEALQYADKERVVLYHKFFQVFPGGYGEGDQFAGIRNPELRTLAKKYQAIHLNEIRDLLIDPIHEIRLLALFIMDLQFKNKKTTEEQKEALVSLYWEHLDSINNWDLVDSSAHHILGAWEFENPSDKLQLLAEHSNKWYNRIAIIATFYFIRKNQFSQTLTIAKLLLNNPHDIVQKAVGWMLREVGNRDRDLEMKFLKQNYPLLQRVALRYAIEKFEEPLRLAFLKGEF